MNRIIIDADAFPNKLKKFTYKYIINNNIETIVVSNKTVSIGENNNLIQYVIVENGFDIADQYISDIAMKNDIVICSDIPLASNVIEKGAFVITFHGKLLNKDNIKSTLMLRNMMQDIRDSGEKIKGKSPFSEKDIANFSNNFNSLVSSF